MTAEIFEIFCSVQGEGLYAGQKQIFVRFAGCDLSCAYCDEQAAVGRGSLMYISKAAEKIKYLAKKEKAKVVSFTGGEPLMQDAALKELALHSRGLGLQTHLETNGVRWRELKIVAGCFDVIAADIKLPSTSSCAYWNEHKKFLSIAPKKTFVKVVVTSNTTASELSVAVKICAEINDRFTFFIQPVTATGKVLPPRPEQLERLYKIAAAHLRDIRILPQLHPLWGVK